MLFESQIIDFKALLPWRKAKVKQQAIRTIVEQQRRMYDPALAAKDAASIVHHIEQMSAFQQAKTVLLYYPIHNEVDLRPLLEKYKDTKTMLLPVTHRHYMEACPYTGEDCLHSGHVGVAEPDTAPYQGNIDLILVPGVAFDTDCHRIGRGGGYYDKYLAGQRKALKVGVCYSFQLRHSRLPQTWHDKRLDRVITPERMVIR